MSNDRHEIVFGAYSAYYDLLYGDKDYAGEAEYISRILLSHAPEASSLLDLGCGTGSHAANLAKLRWSVHGVDRSEDMLNIARRRHASLNDGDFARLSFSFGDAREVRLRRYFDVVTALFHVASYQTRNEDLAALFETAHAHLMPGGIFFFDFWYGPAVLVQKPETRIRRLGNSCIDVLRIAEPVLHPNMNVVEVNYEIQITPHRGGTPTRLKEAHAMRYLFLPEVERWLSDWDMHICRVEEWMTGRPAGEGTWSVCVAARKGS